MESSQANEKVHFNMSKVIKKITLGLIYFLFWIVFYTVTYFGKSSSVTLLPQFKNTYHIYSIMILFIKSLPAFEIVLILIFFSSSIASRSAYQLKKHSPQILNLVSKLFLMCILASTINMISAELIRPYLIYNTRNQIILSQKYYENINAYNHAINNKDYQMAKQCLKVALSIWDDSPEALSLQSQLANTVEESPIVQVADKGQILNTASLLENMSENEILKIARNKANISDFYTAYLYANLVAKMAKDNEELKKEAYSLQVLCMQKIELGSALDELEEFQRQFEAKKSAYDTLTQKDYERSYYAFLSIKDDIYSKTKKYDPDVEKYLELSRDKLLEQVYFIEEIENISSFDSGYNVAFKIANTKESFKIGSYYFSSTKDSFAIYVSQLIYSKTQGKDASSDIHIKLPFAKIIEKEVDGKKGLYLIGQARSRYSQDKQISSNAIIEALPNKIFPLELNMSLKDFSLIVLAQQDPHVMTIIDLYNFAPIAEKYGFYEYIYRAELCTRFADFFLFIIFTSLFSITAFKMRAKYASKCTFLFVLATVIFPHVIFIFLESLRYIFKLTISLLATIGLPFPCMFILIILFIIFLFSSYLLYNIGSKEG